VINQIAKFPLKFLNSNGDEIETTQTTDLKKLILQPNYYQNWPELIKQFFAYYEILGNAYLYKTTSTGFNQPTSLFAIPAQGMRVNLMRDKQTNPAWMNEIAGYDFTIGSTKNSFTPEEILFKRYVNLNFQDGRWVYGISKYIPGQIINTDLAAIYDSRTNIISRRGALGFLTNKSQVPDQAQTKAVQDALNFGKYGTLSTQEKFIATTQILDWVQMSMNIQELQLIENANYDFNKICQLNGIDPVIFSTQGSTFANKAQASKQFIANVLVPKIDDFYLDFNEWISEQFNGETVWVDWSKVAELKEDRSSLTVDLDKQIRSGIITPKKAHEILYGDPDNDASDEYYFTTNIVNADKVDAPPVEPIVTEENIKHLFNGNKAKAHSHAD